MQSSNAGEAGLWPHALSTAMEKQSLLSSLASQWHQHFVPLTVSVLGQWMKPWWNQGMWMNSGWPTTSSSNFQPVEKIALPRTFGSSSMSCNGWLPITRSRTCLGRTVLWLLVLSSFLFLFLLLSLFPLLVVVMSFLLVVIVAPAAIVHVIAVVILIEWLRYRIT